MSMVTLLKDLPFVPKGTKGEGAIRFCKPNGQPVFFTLPEIYGNPDWFAVTNKITKVNTGEFVKGIEPLVLTTNEAEAMQFADAESIATGLEIAEGEAFKISGK